MANCGADTEANLLIGSLTADASFPIPDPDLSGIVFPSGALDHPVTPLTLADLTTTTVDGTGAFETLMRGFKSHLDVEFESGRITGDDYTKAYIALTESAMSQGAAFLLQKDQAFWQAQLIQVQAFTAQVQFETAKIQLAEAQYSASVQKAQYALTKMKIATEEVAYCTGKFNLEQLLPVELEKSTLVKEGQIITNNTATFNLQDMLPVELEKTVLEKEGQLILNNTATYNLSNMLPKQLENLGHQGNMLKEQTEAQRAQTLDTRQDGSVVLGVLGKQKLLYAQQITSYQRDAELKAARIWSDSWITQKTIDEGLLPPATLENATVNTVLETIRINNNL